MDLNFLFFLNKAGCKQSIDFSSNFATGVNSRHLSYLLFIVTKFPLKSHISRIVVFIYILVILRQNIIDESLLTLSKPDMYTNRTIKSLLFVYPHPET